MSANLKYRPELDGLRALAVTTVVLYHALVPGFDGGFMGVDVFFVLSGYLITNLLYNEISAGAGLDWINFYARRIRRLAPAAFVVVMVTLAIGLLVLWPTGELQELAKSAAASALWSANIWFQFHGLDYFESHGRGREFLHLWSLGVEEQFYIVWPWLLLLAAWLAKRLHRLTAVVFIGVLLLATLVSLGLNLWLVKSNQPAAFFQMPLRAFELSIGGLFTFLPRHAWRRWFAWLGFALLMGGFWLVNDTWTFPGATALIPTLSTALMLWGFTAPHWLATHLFTQPLAVWIGQRSYSWYLWHWPLLALWRDYWLGDVSSAQAVLVCLLGLLCAHLTYVYVEMPARHGRQKAWSSNRRSIATGGALLLAMLVASASIELWAKFVGAKQPIPQRMTAEIADLDRRGLDCMNTIFADWQKAFQLPDCQGGDPAASTRLFIWGDSHAGAQRAMLESYVADKPLALAQRTSPGCTALLDWDPWNTSKRQECISFTARMQEEVKAERSAGRPAAIVLANRWPNMVSPTRLSVLDRYQWNRDVNRQDFAKTAQLFRTALDSSFGSLGQLGVPVLVIAPVPEMIYDVPRCLARFGEPACRVPRALVERHREGVLQMLKVAVARHPTVRLVDPIGLFCDAQWCYARRQDVTLYIDDDHLSAAAARQLAPLFQQQLDWLVQSARRLALPPLAKIADQPFNSAAPETP